jgi:S1-C subfamily serine protease/antitoxin component YwqK of YwqJK toxin-antitoxin module
MKNNKNLITLFFIIGAILASSQTNKQKIYFDRNGKITDESIANHYRTVTDTANFYRSFFVSNGKISFEGKISKASNTDETQNVYEGECKWYYKNGAIKEIKNYNSEGKENGLAKYYYESGKLNKEIELKNGKPLASTYLEYDEDGTKNKIFEEDFNNNNNDWDLYMSDKTASSITAGQLEIVSLSKEGSSRYINYPVKSDIYTVEADVNIATIKDIDKCGLIFGYKDWQNYHYFVVGKKYIFIGSVYEGVKSVDADAMYCSSLNPLENNNLKILSNGEKLYYSVNGEIQFTSNMRRLYGNNFGFITSGNSKMKIEKMVIKEKGLGESNKSISPTDKDIKATGSGIIFSVGGYILTNHHVINDAKKIAIEISENDSKKTYSAKVIVKDEDNDLAVIKIDDESFKPLKSISYAFKENGQIEVGAAVFTIGYPFALSGMGKDAKFTDGKISAKTGYDGALNAFQSTIPVQPGNSGGPVFNYDGQLIGAINSTIKNTDNVSYAIKLNYIKNLIELLPDKVDLPADNAMKALNLEDKIKALTNYVVLIKIK